MMDFSFKVGCLQSPEKACPNKRFVCLFNRSLHGETHLGPDGTRLEKNPEARLKTLYKHAGQLVYGNGERERETDFEALDCESKGSGFEIT